MIKKHIYTLLLQSASLGRHTMSHGFRAYLGLCNPNGLRARRGLCNPSEFIGIWERFPLGTLHTSDMSEMAYIRGFRTTCSLSTETGRLRKPEISIRENPLEKHGNARARRSGHISQQLIFVNMRHISQKQ